MRMPAIFAMNMNSLFIYHLETLPIMSNEQAISCGTQLIHSKTADFDPKSHKTAMLTSFLGIFGAAFRYLEVWKRFIVTISSQLTSQTLIQQVQKPVKSPTSSTKARNVSWTILLQMFAGTTKWFHCPHLCPCITCTILSYIPSLFFW